MLDDSERQLMQRDGRLAATLCKNIAVSSVYQTRLCRAIHRATAPYKSRRPRGENCLAAAASKLVVVRRRGPTYC